MTTRTRRITDQSEDDTPTIEAAYDDVSQMADDQERMENEINAEIGAPDGDVRWKIKVYRVEPQGKDLAYLFELVGESIEGLSDRLRDEYGTGKYVARVYRNGKLHKSPVLKVEAAKNKAPAQQPDARGDALVALVQQLGASQQALLQQVAALKASPPVVSSPVDPVGMFTGMAAMIKAMKEFMPQPAHAENPMQMVTQVIELVKGVSDNGKEKGMFDLISEALQSPLLAKAVESAQQPAQPQLQQRPRPQIQAPVATPSPANAPPANATPAAPAQSDDDAKFAALLATLVSRAANNSDPALYADVIEDMIDRTALDGLLSLPDPVGMLAQVNPAVATYRVWFASLIEALTDNGEGEQMGGAPDIAEPAIDASGNRSASIGANVAS